MSISKLINKMEANNIFREVISENSVLNSMWRYLKTNPKIFTVILLTISILSIYTFGKDIGEFFYYITQ